MMFWEVNAQNIRIRHIRMLILLIHRNNVLQTFNVVISIVSHSDTKINSLDIRVKAIFIIEKMMFTNENLTDQTY